MVVGHAKVDDAGYPEWSVNAKRKGSMERRHRKIINLS